MKRIAFWTGIAFLGLLVVAQVVSAATKHGLGPAAFATGFVLVTAGLIVWGSSDD